jgi:hypothetical protein
LRYRKDSAKRKIYRYECLPQKREISQINNLIDPPQALRKTSQTQN